MSDNQALAMTTPDGGAHVAKMKLSRSEPNLMKLWDEMESDTSTGETTEATTASTICTDNGDEEELTDIDDGIPDLPSPSPMTEKKRTVSFGNLEELSFPVVRGDPNFEMAYPMTLGWDCLDGSTQTIDAYEANRAPRRTQDEMRTMSEQRRKIIKDHKKQQKKHRRRESIGNGQIGMDLRRNRMQDFLMASLAGPTKSDEKSEQGAQPPRRGTLRRQNSIGNGQIGKDTRRNLVQDFLTSITKSSRSDSSKRESDSVRSEELKPTQETPRRGTLRRQNSIGNGQITRDRRRNGIQEFLKASATAMTKSTKSDDNSQPKSPRRGVRRQNSIGNGQISRDKRRVKVQEFMKKMSFAKQ